MLPSNSTNSSANEDERIKALRQYDILDTTEEVEFNNITKLAALVCNMPNALISLVDEDRLYIKSVLGGSSHTQLQRCIFQQLYYPVRGLIRSERYAVR